jgi:hypothetical protein
MRSNAGMANRQGDVNLRFAQVSAPSQNFGLAWLGLAGSFIHSFIVQDAQQQESRPNSSQSPKEAAATQENLTSAGTGEAIVGHHQRSNSVGDQEYICQRHQE